MAASAQAIQVGGKTAQEITKEVMASTEDTMLTISGLANTKLETVVRYLNREKISARGDAWFRRNHDNLVTDAVEQLISAREKAITSYLDKKELQEKDEAFRELVARGTVANEAYKQVFGK